MSFPRNTNTSGFTLDPRNNPEFIFVGRSGGVPGNKNAGRSTGAHAHLEHRDANGNLVDPAQSGLLSNLVFQKPDGSFAYAKTKDKNGQWAFDPNFIITSKKGEDRGTHKHAGIDAALPENTALYMPRSYVTGKIAPQFDPGGYGQFADIGTKDGSLLIGHTNAINTFTPGGQATSSETGETASAPATPTTPSQTQQPGTTLNVNFDLGELLGKKKETNFAEQYVASMLQGLMKTPDYMSMIGDTKFFS